jgi:hypothetical protein
VETALTYPAQYLVARATYRTLRDTTQRAMLHGDGPLPPLIPREAMRGQSLASGYRASDETVYLANGAEIVFRSLEENDPEKVRGLTLAGVLVDQIEELRYDGGEHLYNEIIGRLSDDRGPAKLLAIANPAALTHWVYRRMVDEKTCDAGCRVVHFTMRDNAENLPADYVGQMLATEETQPHWYRTFVLGEWGAIEDAAYPEFDRRTHVVPAFDIPAHWRLFESMDHGIGNATAWLWYAIDTDGNAVVVDEHYLEGELPDVHATAVKAKREHWRNTDEDGKPTPMPCYGDPNSLRERIGTRGQWGEPMLVQDLYQQQGVWILPANDRRRAGYARVRSLLRPQPDRPFPAWHERFGEKGSPQLFLVGERSPHLVEQLMSAPLANEENDPERGEAVARKWERHEGHAHAALRYGLLTYLPQSKEPAQEETDPRKQLLEEIRTRHLDRHRGRRGHDEWTEAIS